MTIKRVLEVLARVASSFIFGVIFYLGWMAITIPITKSGWGGLSVRAMIWISGPILTGLGFAVGSKIYELLPARDNTPFRETYMWCLAGCAVGGGILFVFGPMLIVFGMLAGGTISILVHEVTRPRKKNEGIKTSST